MQDIEKKMLNKKALGEGYKLTLYPGDFVWLAALGAMFVVCLELFYRMIVNYHGNYPSDLRFYAVNNIENPEEKGRLIGELFEYLYRINQDYVEIDVFMAALIVMIIVANFVTIRFFIKDDGYLDKVPRYAIQFFSVALLFMGPIYVPFVYERYFRHAFKSFAWQSPTHQAMLFFALLAMICFLKLYMNSEEEGLSIKWWLLTAITTFMATFAKPSYTINLALAVVVMFIIDLIRGGAKDVAKRFARLFVIGCSLIPSGIYMLWLFFGDSQFDDDHTVIIDFAHVLEFDNIPGAIVFCLTLPIAVFALNSERFKDPKYRFSLYIFIMGMVQWAMFYETGKWAKHGNFTWGRTLGIYFIMLASAAVILEIYYDKEGKFADKPRKRRIYLIILAVILAASILSQLNYFRLIITGHGYQL